MTTRLRIALRPEPAAPARQSDLPDADSLTGLLTHRQFQERLREETQRASRSQQPCALVIFDIDEFTRLNSQHGHAAGDELLRSCGTILAESCRPGDVPARYGGGEFALVLPGDDAAAAADVAERVRARIAAQLPVTASAGVCAAPADGASATDLMTHALAALRAAKRAGRDQVRSWTREVAGADLEPVAATATESIAQLRLLQSIASRLTRLNEVWQIGQTIATELRALVDYHACRVYMLEEGGTALLPVALRGDGAYAGETIDDLRVELGEGITGSAAARAETLVIDDAGACEFGVEIPGSQRIDESILAVPLRYEGRVTGAIVLTKLGLAQFGPADVRLLETLASQAAVALENARLYERERTAAQNARALLEMAGLASSTGDVQRVARKAVALTRTLVGCPIVHVHLRDPTGTHTRLLASAGLTPSERRTLARVPIPPPAAGAHEPSADGSFYFTEATVVPAGTRGELLPRQSVRVVVPMVAGGERLGSLIAAFEQPNAHFRPQDLAVLTGIADQTALAVYNRQLFSALEDGLLSTIEALATTLETRDQYTAGHADDIAELAVAVGRELGLNGSALRDLEWAARFHDIGKIGVPNEILNKPGSLTPAEWLEVRRHPELGAKILAPVAQLAGAAEIVSACHEHFDGSGYPEGLRRDEIPLGARIVLVCDAYHAMTSDRPYRRAMPAALALHELQRNRSTQFDPAVVTAFLASRAASFAKSA